MNPAANAAAGTTAGDLRPAVTGPARHALAARAPHRATPTGVRHGVTAGRGRPRARPPLRRSLILDGRSYSAAVLVPLRTDRSTYRRVGEAAG